MIRELEEAQVRNLFRPRRASCDKRRESPDSGEPVAGWCNWEHTSITSWAGRSTGGFLVCTQKMRVRFPLGPPMGASANGQATWFSTTQSGFNSPCPYHSVLASCCGLVFEGTRLAHNQHQAGFDSQTRNHPPLVPTGRTAGLHPA